jgi:hypothetical protein
MSKRCRSLSDSASSSLASGSRQRSAVDLNSESASYSSPFGCLLMGVLQQTLQQDILEPSFYQTAQRHGHRLRCCTCLRRESSFTTSLHVHLRERSFALYVLEIQVHHGSRGALRHGVAAAGLLERLDASVTSGLPSAGELLRDRVLDRVGRLRAVGRRRAREATCQEARSSLLPVRT